MKKSETKFLSTLSDRFSMTVLLYQNDEELYNGTAYDFDVQGIQEQLGEVELHGKWYDADTYIC